MREENSVNILRNKAVCIYVAEALKFHLSTAVPAQSLIDLIDHDGHVFEALNKQVRALPFDLLKLQPAFPGCFGAGVKSWVNNRKWNSATSLPGTTRKNPK